MFEAYPVSIHQELEISCDHVIQRPLLRNRWQGGHLQFQISQLTRGFGANGLHIGDISQFWEYFICPTTSHCLASSPAIGD